MVTAERARELLSYDPETGSLIWQAGRHRGNPAGYTDSHGYIKVMIDGRNYYAHRLAWLLMTGEWPVGIVDHRNTDESDNRWSNLRAASNAQNRQNAGKSSVNTSGFKGVHHIKRTGRFQAYISLNGKRAHLGYFDTPEEAHAAYVAAAERYFGEYARAA